MIDQELIQQVTNLSPHERLELIELITRSLNKDAKATQGNGAKMPPHSEGVKSVSVETMTAVEQLAASLGLRVPADSSLHQLRGIVSTDAVPATKGETRDFIADYLAEKYS